jgi:hypothetical protein
MPEQATTSHSMAAIDSETAGAAQTSERIERLLTEVRATVSPLAWQRVEELLQTVVGLYGRGLGRVLDLLHAAQALDAAVARTLAADELVASLLSLHGLHPWPARQRIEAALETVAPQLGRIEIVALDAQRVRLRALDAPPSVGAGETIERLVQEAAPELEAIEIEGLRAAATRGPLVQIDLARSAARREP